jgi:hypothetical protein
MGKGARRLTEEHSASAVVLAALKSAGVRVALPHDGVITERAGEERQRSSQVGPSRNFIYHRFVQLVPKSLRVSLFWLMGRGSVSISTETIHEQLSGTCSGHEMFGWKHRLTRLYNADSRGNF